MSAKDNTSDDGPASPTVGGKEISAVLDGEDPDSILGFCVMSTTGDHLYVPRDWLDEQFDKHGISRKYFPNAIKPWMAYGRMLKILLDRRKTEVLHVHGKNRKVNYQLLDGEAKEHILQAQVFHDEDESGEEAGDWKKVRLGRIDFDKEAGEPLTYREVDDNEPRLKKRWENRFEPRVYDLFDTLLDHHHGDDMRQRVLEAFLEESNTVRYRNGAYFVPITKEKEVKGLQQIWQDMNQYKERGQRTHITAIPVVATEDQKVEIERRAKAMLNNMVEDIVDAAIDRLQEEEDETAERVAKEFVHDISEAEGFAAEYNQILEAEFSMRKVLDDEFDHLKDEKAELVESVKDELDDIEMED